MLEYTAEVVAAMAQARGEIAFDDGVIIVFGIIAMEQQGELSTSILHSHILSLFATTRLAFRANCKVFKIDVRTICSLMMIMVEIE
jgi:hypothetical protein